MTYYVTPEVIASYYAADLYENVSGFQSGLTGGDDNCNDPDCG
ncbi:MAG TPA: hypothetical protein VIG51_02745 [Candidatus Baltobacteraceae bacterium]|jgi:hypothetical protein